MCVCFSRSLIFPCAAQVYKNIDDLFGCPGKLCATFINPCIFNAGLMVFNPSQATFVDMAEKLPVTESFDGADQGFLNQYFPDLLAAPLYRGLQDSVAQVSRSPCSSLGCQFHRPAFSWRQGQGPVASFYRLPFYFHVDHGFYYPRFKWDMEFCCLRAASTFFLHFLFAVAL